MLSVALRQRLPLLGARCKKLLSRCSSVLNSERAVQINILIMRAGFRRTSRGSLAWLEGVEARQRASDRKLVDGLGALVGDDAFEVEHMADRDELGTDARAA
jgi:hypothetical protein